MGFFSWILNGICDDTNDESLLFVKALCEQDTPLIEESRFGYRFNFELGFPECEIDLTYDSLRKYWYMNSIWNKEGGFLYYWDSLSIPPKDTIDYLIDKFDLTTRLNTALEKFNEQEKLEKASANAIKRKYLT